MSQGVVNVCVANLYEQDSYRSQVVTQAILGEPAGVHDRRKNFTLVELPDTYRGWISNHQLVAQAAGPGGEVVTIRDHWVRIFRQPDAASTPVRDAVIGTRLYRTGTEGTWIGVQLPDGQQGWIDGRSIGAFPAADRKGVVALAKEFLGYPYYWGGRSPKGFDCSGLTQTVFGLLGIALPRDSWMQYEAGAPVREVAPGDLYFFAEGGDRITHVGLACGDGYILHARGYVRINSLDEGKAGYSAELAATLAGIRSFL
jgi:cell wall-associated NlpC family hydrolase